MQCNGHTSSRHRYGRGGWKVWCEPLSQPGCFHCRNVRDFHVSLCKDESSLLGQRSFSEHSAGSFSGRFLHCLGLKGMCFTSIPAASQAMLYFIAEGPCQVQRIWTWVTMMTLPLAYDVISWIGADPYNKGNGIWWYLIVCRYGSSFSHLIRLSLAVSVAQFWLSLILGRVFGSCLNLWMLIWVVMWLSWYGSILSFQCTQVLSFSHLHWRMSNTKVWQSDGTKWSKFH